jgi:type II secretory pathway pseudopilin PulG
MFTIKRNKATKDKNSAGYSLIELATVMIIIGLLVAPMLAAYASYQKKLAFEVTDDNIALVSTAMGAYRAMNGRYPCPASLTADRESPDYGREGDCSDTSIAPGSCEDGVCVKNSVRTNAGVPIRVRVGAIPFRHLNVNENTAYDAYGQRLTYVLTEDLGDKDRFKMDGGGIGVIDNQVPPVSVIGTGPMENTAHFLILSHGANGKGAYLQTGQLREACGQVTDNLESINCQGPDEPPIYRQALYSTSDTFNYSDDTISYFVRGEVTPWLVSENDRSDIYLKDLSPDARVGVDTSAMLNDKVKVNSIARARTELKTMSLCDQAGNNCTYADLIAGDHVDMECPPGEYMVAIGQNRRECKPEIFEKCPAGQVVRQLTTQGAIVCGNPPVPPVPPKDCVSRNVSLCSANHTLPAGPHGETFTITAGASATQTFRCNNGTWSSISTSGDCICTPETQTRNNSCGTGYTGSIVQTRTYQCPQGIWTPWTTTTGGNTCACAIRAPEMQRGSCPAEYTGTGEARQRDWTCNAAGTSGSWGSWYVTAPANCSCTNKTENRTFNCSGGLSGTYSESRTFTCANNRWSAWAQTSNNCTCVPRNDETRTVACPSGYTGSISQTRKFNCTSSSGSWGNWTETSRDCKIVPAPVCTWEATGSGLDQTAKRGSRVGDQCTCGASGQCHEVVGAGLYYNYNSCSCQ